MASCGAERHISLWNPYTCSETGRLEGHTAPVLDLVVNDKEKQIVSVSLDSVIKVRGPPYRRATLMDAAHTGAGLGFAETTLCTNSARQVKVGSSPRCKDADIVP